MSDGDCLASSQERADGSFHASSLDESSSDFSDNSDDDHEKIFDMSREVDLLDHTRVVTTLDVDPHGAYLISGGRDGVKMWDFNSMRSTLRPFRSFDPVEDCSLKSLRYNTTGGKFLAAGSMSQAYIYDREGMEVSKTIRGDVYIRDMRQTKGHIAAITSCEWHPFKKDYFLTSSYDGTVRVWNMNNLRSQERVIVAKSGIPGFKCSISSASYSRDGKVIAAGVSDGSIKIWNTNSTVSMCTKTAENAHEPSSVVSDIKFSTDYFSLFTRCTDHTLKQWDLRQMKSPVESILDLRNLYDETAMCFSPDEKYIITGTSSEMETDGKLVFFLKSNLKKVHEISFGNSSVIGLNWNLTTNQIFMGMDTGCIKALYSPKFSKGGIITPLGRASKKITVDSLETTYSDLNMCALVSNGEDINAVSISRKRDRERINPSISYRPEPSPAKQSKGPKFGSSLLTQYIIKDAVERLKEDEDPRAAILKYTKVSEENPYWIAPAYKKNQPKSIFAPVETQDEDDDEPPSKEIRS